MKTGHSLLAFVATLAAASGWAANAPTARPQGDQGTVIRGDQEAPLVLYIVPWQDTKMSALPEAPMLPLLPKVLDDERSLVDDPAQRSLNPGRQKTK